MLHNIRVKVAKKKLSFRRSVVLRFTAPPTMITLIPVNRQNHDDLWTYIIASHPKHGTAQTRYYLQQMHTTIEVLMKVVDMASCSLFLKPALPTN